MTTTRPRLGTTPGPGTALIATGDRDLRDQLLRLTAATGIEPVLASATSEVLAGWHGAAVVFVGADMVDRVATVNPTRRPGIQVISWGEPPTDIFRSALALGAESVLCLPDSDQVATDLLLDLADEAGGPGRLIGVMGGCGGAGATTLTAAIAQSAARSGSVLAVDLDLFGPGLDWVLGLEDQPGIRWHDIGDTNGRLSARSLRESLPHRESLSVLTWAAGGLVQPTGEVVREVVSAGTRGHRVTVVDLGRHQSDQELMSRLDLLVLVTRPEVCALTSTARTARLVRGSVTSRLVVRGDAWPDDVAAAVGVEVLTVMSDQRGLREAVDLGLGPLRRSRGPLVDAATAVLRAAGVQESGPR